MTAKELVETLARMTTPTDGITDEVAASDIIAGLDGDTAEGDALCLYGVIRLARDIVARQE